MITVYMHTCRVSEKSYIGITRKTIEVRWREHCQWTARGSKFLFHNAIRKYGVEVWDHRVLAVVETVQDAKALEAKFIDQEGTHRAGYNMTAGGDGMRGLAWTDQRRELLRQKLLGQAKPREMREKIARSLRGRPPSAKATEALSGLYEITHPCGRVEMVRGLQAFNRKHGLSNSSMRRLVNGKHETWKGFRARRIAFSPTFASKVSA